MDTKKIEKNNKNNKNDINNKKTLMKKSRSCKDSNVSDAQNISDRRSNSKTSKLYKNFTEKPAPKKRGRRPKKVLDVTDVDIPNANDNSQNDSAVILRLPKIDPSKLENIKKKQIRRIVSVPEYSDDNINDESSEGMFRNDIPKDNICNKCLKNEKELNSLKTELFKYKKKDKMDKSSKIHNNAITFISFDTGKKITIKKTNIKCWWDSNQFDNLPCVLPELYHDGKYYVRGCFCSFNCALAYNLHHIKDSKIGSRKSLVFKLYRELYGYSSDEPIEIKLAQPKETLEDFGGSVSIKEFRSNFTKLNKEFIVYVPPLKPINIIIEEKNIETNAELNEREYVLKRSKPLAKGRSLMSTMKFSK
ncbi:putative viral transcription factor [Cotonvirus japonicus]|uniref:Viral transcription factor n=1 Tax=Cotonvirus japonicus TaxID=2811091 RepID=A0ABM7NSJ1_9VIRU|nr:putative viral transcription factor [Cotonvirus japonicus]BCS83091.1 putative viral transcription factor [Cotonvirus japonicus]